MGRAWPIVTVKIFECGLIVGSLSECSGRWAFPLYLLMTTIQRVVMNIFYNAFDGIWNI